MPTEEYLTQLLQSRPYRYFPKTGSTNDEALAWMAEGAPDGAIVIADEQTKGRGRMGRSWYAPAGSALLFTMILRPSATVLSRITMLGGLAVCEAIRELGFTAGIKWANDVQVHGKKVSGVLPEAAWSGEVFAGTVLGIGVNISVDFRGSPYESTAASLREIAGAPVDWADVLTVILKRIDHWYARLETPELFQAWRSNLNMLGSVVTVDGHSVVAEDVDPDGALVVRDQNGVRHRVIAGDIGVG